MNMWEGKLKNKHKLNKVNDILTSSDIKQI